MSAAEKVSTIGIDLGTTYCCVGVLRGDEVELIPNDQGNINTPNYVAFTDTGCLVGDSAKSQASRNPSNTVFDIMRLIGNKIDKSYTQKYHLPYTVIENEGRLKLAVNYRGELQVLSPETIVAMVLKNLKKTAEHYIGHRVTQAVISVPANFNYCQRQAVKEAGHIIGLNVLKLINGPTAAALTYGLRHKSNTLQNVLIFDLGGGTANASIVSISSSSTFEVLATAGDAHLGGEDFDNRLISHFAKEFQEKFNKSISENKRALNRLRAACEQVKKNLSAYETGRIEIDALLDGIDFSSQITRTQFDGLCYDLFTHTRFLFERTLHDANLEIDEIHEVVLVGGSSRIPFIQEMISVIFSGKTLNKSINPEEAVARGAALQGAVLNKDKNAIVKGVLLMDVAPFSLGVMSKCGEMDFFLKRGEPIPTRISRVFTTFSDNLPSMTVKLYEGECTHVKDNTFIGSFYITKIAPAKKGVPQIQVIFDIDANCSLKVEFQDQGTGKMFTIHIDSNKERPKKQDIEGMLKDARPYKDKAKKQKRKPMPREDDPCKNREKKEDSKPMPKEDDPCKNREKKEDSKPMPKEDDPCKDREKKKVPKPMPREDDPCKDRKKKEDSKPMPREDEPCTERLQQQESEQRLKLAEQSMEENRRYQEKLSAKTQLENYVHSIKEKAESLLKTCNSTLEWLDSSSSLHEKEVYAAKMKKLQQSAFLMSGPYCQEQCDS